MAASNTKALIYSLLTGLLTAFGMAVLLAVVYAVTSIWLAGHNLVLWGWNGTYVTGFNWPEFIFQAGTLLTGVLTTALCYRSWRPPHDHRHDS